MHRRNRFWNQPLLLNTDASPHQTHLIFAVHGVMTGVIFSAVGIGCLIDCCVYQPSQANYVGHFQGEVGLCIGSFMLATFLLASSIFILYRIFHRTESDEYSIAVEKDTVLSIDKASENTNGLP